MADSATSTGGSRRHYANAWRSVTTSMSGTSAPGWASVGRKHSRPPIAAPSKSIAPTTTSNSAGARAKNSPPGSATGVRSTSGDR